MKKVTGIYSGTEAHWVGDGFPVRTLFSYNNHGSEISPFILLDLAGPHTFAPSTNPRGVGEHPHRGFETVTIVLQGEVSHRDSTGQGGTIGPGDVQWMTAGSGIMHEEFHSEAFTQAGGTIEMAQLWVNLPAKHKMTQPGYQSIVSNDIPVISLGNNQGNIRVIAGEYDGQKGPANTFSPMTVLDVTLAEQADVTLTLPQGWTTGISVMQGVANVNENHTAFRGQTVIFDRDGEQVRLVSEKGARLLILSGEPLDEPVVGYGPFVMNTQQEIRQAIEDIRNNRFGAIG